MGGRRTAWATALGLVLLATAATAASPGYLAPGSTPDMVRVLPKPPAPKSAIEAEDRRAFAVTRRLKGTDRWRMAVNDVQMGPEAAFADYACSLGVGLDASSAPTLHLIYSRLFADTRPFVQPPKDHYARLRPFVGHKGEVCEPSAPIAKSGSYPSGHSTLAWAWGLILAELAPDRATEILSRARAYTESRVVCGSHYPSDISAGRLNGSAMFAALQASPEFRADMEKARAEVAAARAAGSPAPDASVCKVEADAERQRPW